MASRGGSAGAMRFDIIASSAQYVKAIRQARGRLKRFADYSKTVARRMASNWRSVGLVIGGLAASFGLAVKGMTDYSSKLVESARATGMATKQLENMRLLLQGDGIGITRTDKAMQEFTVRLGFAQRGIGQYTRAFEGMGVTLRNQDGTLRAQKDVLQDVAAALQNNESHAEAASLAYELFGRSGKELLPILQRYGADLSEAAEHAGRFRTLTDDQHVLNKALGQSVFDLTENTKDLVQRGLALAAPHLKTIVDELNQWISAIKENPGVLEGFKAFAEGLGTTLSFVAKTLATTIVGFGYMYKAIRAVIDPILDLFTTSPEEALAKYERARDRLAQHRNLINPRTDEPLSFVDDSKRVAAYRQSEGYLTLEKTLLRSKNEAAVQLQLLKLKQAERDTADKINSYSATIDFRIGSDGQVGDGGLLAEEVAKETEKGAVKGLKLGLSRSSIKNTRMLKEFSMVVAEEIGATMVAAPDLLISRSPRSQDGAASFRRRRYARSLRDGTRDSMRMRHSYYPSMFDQFADARYPTDLNQTGAYIGFFKEGAQITAAAKEIVNEVLKITPGRDFRDRQKAARTRGEFYTPYGLDIGNSSGSSILTALTDGAIITGAPAKKAAETITKTIYQDRQKAARTRGEFYERWGPVGPTSSVMGGQAYAQDLMEQRNAGGAYRGRVYSGSTDWRQMADASLAMKEYLEGVQRSKELTAEFTNVFDSWGNSVLSNFTNVRDAVESLIGQIAKMMMQRWIVSPLVDAAGGLLGGIFGGADKAMTSKNPFEVFGLGKANGGLASGLTLVGERGPELVDFSKPGQVYSNERLRAAMAGGGAGVTINYTINSTDGPGVRAALAKATPGIVNAALARTMDESTRFGEAQRMIRG